MPDVAAFRAKLATIVPSTNTIVEADFNHLFRVPGVTFHTGRVYVEWPARGWAYGPTRTSEIMRSCAGVGSGIAWTGTSRRFSPGCGVGG